MAAKAAKPDSKITALLKKRKRNKEGEDGPRSSAFDFMDGGKATKKSEKIAKKIFSRAVLLGKK